MNRKLIIPIVAVILVLVLAIFGLPLFSQLYYHRSQAATMFAWQLEKEAYTTEEDFQDLLLQKTASNTPPYLIPMDVSFSVSLESDIYEGMQYYILNSQTEPEKLIFYFPGGSFTDQPRGVHWQFLDRLSADTGAMIVVPIYPKIPAHDAQTSYATVSAFFQMFMAEHTCEELLFMGDSAGGGMALSLAMQLRDLSIPGPERLLLICPWVDVTMTNPQIPAYEKKDTALDSQLLARLGELWAGELEGTDPMVSPLYGNLEGLGELILYTSKGELLYPDILALLQKLDEAGIAHTVTVSPGMFHVWPLYSAYNIPEVQATYEDIATIIKNES